MQEKILNCTILANSILDDCANKIQHMLKTKVRHPALAVILIGNNPASAIYVKNKKNACSRVGIESLEYLLPESTTEKELLNLIEKLNNDNNIDGILVQLPLPKHLDSKLIINAIMPTKDVDGFHAYNMGSLAVNNPLISPCTPLGVIYILDNIKLNYLGKHAVIIGASNIVGRPMALELLNKGATVTICNNKTKNIEQITKTADILIVAVGKAKMVQSNWVKDNSIVIDIGINKLPNGQICGDVDFENLLNKVQYITPVPGGVGKMTIAMLIKNTLQCYMLGIEESNEKKSQKKL